MAMILPVTAVLLHPLYVHLITEYQDGIFADLYDRFMERFDTVLDAYVPFNVVRSVQYLPPSFREVPAAPRREIALYLDDGHLRSRRFPLHMAILEGNLQVVQRILACRPSFLTLDAIHCAVRHQRLAIVEALLPLVMTNSSHAPMHTNLINVAAAANNLPLLLYLHEHDRDGLLSGRQTFTAAISSAAHHGNMDMLHFLLAHHEDDTAMPSTFLSAVEGGHVPTVNFFLHEFRDPQSLDIATAMTVAAQADHVDVFALLVARHRPIHDDDVVVPYTLYAVARPAVLAWLVDHVFGRDGGASSIPTYHSWRCLDAVARGGHVTLVRRVLDHLGDRASSTVAALLEACDPFYIASLDMAAMVRDAYVATGAPRRFLSKMRPASVDAARFLGTRGTRADVVCALTQWMTRLDNDDDDAVDPLVAWLHDTGGASFTTTDMDRAVAAGALPVVRFLHRVVSGRCTWSAMDAAVRHGHVHVARYLWTHRLVGDEQDDDCAAWLRRAVDDGHLDMVTFLVRDMGVSVPPDLWLDVAPVTRQTWQRWWDVALFLLDDCGACTCAGHVLHLAVPVGRVELVHRIAALADLTRLDIQLAIERAIRLGAVNLLDSLMAHLVVDDSNEAAIDETFRVEMQALVATTAANHKFSGPWPRWLV
ncbi:Aste57867_17521 [Aphanomyces stellatus]|uniref:Aste57867_17521 protein n=1 Tax=Aphanomyces stellatus TaxID=120398 RepID=A0A485L8P7_9STRA|nr:hypothetical protein As57867_017461 [Aphanomyces stellatus]VFT94274.1 Aste57867_17521 [Aphanomyces stellatus]